MDDKFNQAALAEFNRSLTELGNSKHKTAALQKSYSRYEKLIAKSIDESTTKPACKAGCAFCCYYKVEVRAHEVFAIKEHLQNNWDNNRIAQVLESAQKNAEIIRNLRPEEHLVTNLKCPFLIDNRCSIYSVRPFKCRNFHATDANTCEATFADPTNLSIENSLIESVASFGNAHSQAFEAATQQLGMDYRAYDFNTALVEVFADPACEKRHKRGKKTFAQAIEILEDE
jgi:Fe-S-cluster containining protein